MMVEPYRDYVLNNDIKMEKYIENQNPLNRLTQLKEKLIKPKLMNLGIKIRGTHPLADIYIDMIARDGDSGKVKHSKHFHGQSWVRQFGDFLYFKHLPVNLSGRTVRDTNNSLETYTSGAGIGFTQSSQMSIFTTGSDGNPGTTNNSSGIVIGSGTATVDISDYQLDSQITSSITHGIMQIDEAINKPNSTTVQFKFVRHFTNLTGDTVVINEVAMYGEAYYSSSFDQFMYERSLVDPAFSFEDNDVAIVGYTIKIIGGIP